MTVSRGPDERVVLPRWRVWRTSENQRELGPLKLGAGALDQVTTGEEAQKELHSRLQEFQHWRGLHHAADVVAAALVLGLEAQKGVQEAAAVMLDAPSSTARAIAQRIIHGIQRAADDDSPVEFPDEEKLRLWIAKQKKILQDQPRNVLAWTDLALAHTVLGQENSAEHSMRIALAQSVGNRFVLRAAARFYMHREDFARAHGVLTSDAERLRADPWLLAAEIAIADSSDRPQRHASYARRLLDKGFAPHDLSELASALATIEIKNGKPRQARKLLSAALVDPTDNALAQAEWSVKHGIYVDDIEQFNPPCNYEAMARYHYRNENFDEALAYAEQWLADQPFALDPALFTSFVAATLVEDQETAIRACRLGLKTNRNNPTLLNNLAFSLANSGSLREAAEVIQRPIADISGIDTAIITATRGLIAFRMGRTDNGRDLYRQAVESLIHEKQAVSAASASLFWVYEELRAGGDGLAEALAFADLTNRASGRGPEIILSRRRLARLASEGNASTSSQVVLTLNLGREVKELTVFPGSN